MANDNKDLKLDKERLVRLQEQQLNAAAGGAEGPGSTTITISPTIDVPLLNATDGTGEKTSGSCCKKSC